MQKKLFIVLGGDGRADSSGHNAKYGSDLVIDLKQSKVVVENWYRYSYFNAIWHTHVKINVLTE